VRYVEFGYGYDELGRAGPRHVFSYYDYGDVYD
jgi:hypothetical protein